MKTNMTQQGKPIVCFIDVKETLRGALLTAGKRMESISSITQELLVIQGERADELVRGMQKLDTEWLVLKHSRRLALGAQETLQGRKVLECWKVAVQMCLVDAKDVRDTLCRVVATTKEPAAIKHLNEITDLAVVLAIEYNTALAQHEAAKRLKELTICLFDDLKNVAGLVDMLLSVIPEQEGGEAKAMSVPQEV